MLNNLTCEPEEEKLRTYNSCGVAAARVIAANVEQ